MSDRFDQLDRPVHRMNFSPAHLDGAGQSASRTIAFRALLGCHFAGPGRLNHAAQSLADFVSRNLDLVVVRCPWSLLDGLDLGSNICCLLENSSELFFQFCLLRVHAILPVT
jgi:hypothetical protein